MTKENQTGTFPGVNYFIGSVPDGYCVLCKRNGVGLIFPRSGEVADKAGICEFCSRSAELVFRRYEGDSLPGTAPTDGIFASLVLIIRKKGETSFEAVMVGRKDEAGRFTLPGGKLEVGESPEDAAVREVMEETGLTVWKAALDVLYTGFAARGGAQLVKVYLARGWTGELEQREGVEVAWKPWPLSKFAGIQAGFYTGMQDAFVSLWKYYNDSGLDFPCVRLRSHVSDYMKMLLEDIGVLKADGKLSEEDRRGMMSAFGFVLSEEEKALGKLIVENERQAAVAAGVIVHKPAEDADGVLDAEFQEIQRREEERGGGDGGDGEGDGDDGESVATKGFVR